MSASVQALRAQVVIPAGVYGMDFPQAIPLYVRAVGEGDRVRYAIPRVIGLNRLPFLACFSSANGAAEYAALDPNIERCAGLAPRMMSFAQAVDAARGKRAAFSDVAGLMLLPEVSDPFRIQLHFLE